MNPSHLLPVLGELLVKSALVLLAALLVNRAWMRASAAQRHLVWCAAFGALLLLPLTRLVPPRWSVPMVRVQVALPVREPLADLTLADSASAPHVPEAVPVKR